MEKGEKSDNLITCAGSPTLLTVRSNPFLKQALEKDERADISLKV